MSDGATSVVRQRQPQADAQALLTHHLLEIQCQVVPAAAAAVLESAGPSKVNIVASRCFTGRYAETKDWLDQAKVLAHHSIQSGRRTLAPVGNAPSTSGGKRDFLLVAPIPAAEGKVGRRAAACIVESIERQDSSLFQTRLELTLSLVNLGELRHHLRDRDSRLNEIQRVLETSAAVAEESRFQTAVLRLCNEVAAQWQCERVSLGFVEGHGVHLQCISGTDQFARKMRLVLDLEAAKDECYDQDIEISYPPPPDDTCVSRAAGLLSDRHGPHAMTSLPLRRDGDVVGVLTCARPAGKSISLRDVEALRLTCELTTSRLIDLRERDRWIGAKAKAAVVNGISGMSGHRHTWAKIAFVCVLAATFWLGFGKMEYRPEASFVLRATHQLTIVAPHDGHLESVSAKVGDRVEAGVTVLGTLKSEELKLQLAALQAEQAAFQTEEAVSLREGKTAEAQMAKAQADRVQAQMDLVNHTIASNVITSEQEGIVVSGDLQRLVGSPFESGDTMFKVARIDSIWAELSVPEDEMPDIDVDMAGLLATASYPDQTVSFTVERIAPMAELDKQRNVFPVRAQLVDKHSWMRPGMRGVARINAGKRNVGWVLTRRVVNWLRMKFWV